MQGYASQQLPLLASKEPKLLQGEGIAEVFQQEQQAVAHRVQQQPRQSSQTRMLPTCLDSVKVKAKERNQCEPMS